MPVTNLDAKGKVIKNPKSASRDYKWSDVYNAYLNYTKLCTNFCIPGDKNMKDMGFHPWKKHMKYLKRVADGKDSKPSIFIVKSGRSIKNK